MSIPVVLTADAKADFDPAADWYEKHGGLGADFTKQVREVWIRIGQMPELRAVLYRQVRRSKIRRFPYKIAFRVDHDRVEIVGGWHR